MQDDFKIRFGIEKTNSVDAQRKFVQRVNAHLFPSIQENEFFTLSDLIPWISLEGGVDWTKLFHRNEYGRYRTFHLEKITGNDFHQTLWVVEKLHQFIKEDRTANIDTRSYMLTEFVNVNWYSNKVEEILDRSETSLGLFWIEGKFYPVGAEELDSKLLKETLIGFGKEEYIGAEKAWENALNEYRNIENEQDSAGKANVIKLAYEALEATSQVLLKNTKDLSANREKLIQTVGLSEHYKTILKEHIEFGNDFRHPSKVRPSINMLEVQTYLYMSGIYIRLVQAQI